MKRFLPLIFVLLIFCRCKKDDGAKNVVTPVVPSISIQSVSYPAFANSTWTNVVGGEALIQLDLLNSGGTVSTSTSDSTNFSSITSYYKKLTAGTYNISVSSKNQKAVADTFIRVNAQIKGLAISDKQVASLTATSTDGLITIGQSFVKGNTVPIFKPDSGTTSYKFGIANGFYYIYVKSGTKGNVVFNAQAGGQTEVATKYLSVTALNQYNLALQTSKGTLLVIFAPFAYNQVAVNSSTLLTLKINTNDYYFTNSDVYFVATDESGNILNSVKYVQGTSTFKLSATNPYAKDRFNFFVIIVPATSAFNPSIKGFLQVKKGSTYTNIVPVLSQKQTYALKPHLKNANGFDDLLMSTNALAREINAPADSATLQQLVYPADSTKLFVQMLKNNKYSYNFFTIPAGATDLNVDLNQVSKAPLTKNITFPTASQSYAIIYGKTNVNYYDAYYFGRATTSANQATVYYPSEPFAEYELMMGYTSGNFNYTFVTSGPAIPGQSPVFNASFNVPASNLGNFAPSFTGTFDYYHAAFLNTGSGSTMQVDLYSPSAANYTNVKLPNFSTYAGLSSFNPNAEQLINFDLQQYSGFNELYFTYKNTNEILAFTNFNCSSISRTYAQ